MTATGMQTFKGEGMKCIYWSIENRQRYFLNQHSNGQFLLLAKIQVFNTVSISYVPGPVLLFG